MSESNIELNDKVDEIKSDIKFLMRSKSKKKFMEKDGWTGAAILVLLEKIEELEKKVSDE